ncbi:hypothetical protein M1M07_23735 [Rhodococcus sp. HM1]|uniref:hypothetical protein n=1 Tax=Rhodococcus sp. HM1 TaxID=2937759 RepID=UPI00200AB25D|nr:hypothetical protein [Rhodococcus sp. HM1]MCK8674109.1 hypothetical protein [Rhodococcus sp. HM1]
MTAEQLDLFARTDINLDHLCATYFNAWSDDWHTVPGVIYWHNLSSETAKDHVRAGIRAVLTELRLT